MNERRRPPRRGRGRRPHNRPNRDPNMDSPYRDDPYSSPGENAPPTSIGTDAPSADATGGGNGETGGAPPPMQQQSQERPQQQQQQQQQNYPPHQHQSRNERFGGNGRRGRRGRGRGGPRQDHQQHQQQQQQYSGPPVPIVADGATAGWFDTNRDAGYIRRAANSYLPDPADAFVPPHLVRQFALRRGDLIEATTGHDHRGRTVTAEVTTVNGGDPALALKRAEFGALIASYPDRRLTLETGRPAKGGPELTRRAIDLIAPIGYGQRALIVAPARAGKTMLLQAITEGVAINHPQAVLLVLLVDERPEEVSEMISWGRGEVIASSFDMPAERHTEVTEMVLERARRLVEGGTDVVIVLDSLTRMARAYNTVERGTGRTLSGGLDATAMAKPKAFFGSARCVAPENGGGSLTIIATALIETGSRMDDVIFEEFKGTGNCEIKLDRSLAEKRIYPAIDIATSGTRKEEKLFKPDQIDAVYTLRRGLGQMPPQAAMEWLIKRIGATTGNDALLAGL